MTDGYQREAHPANLNVSEGPLRVFPTVVRMTGFIKYPRIVTLYAYRVIGVSLNFNSSWNDYWKSDIYPTSIRPTSCLSRYDTFLHTPAPNPNQEILITPAPEQCTRTLPKHQPLQCNPPTPKPIQITTYNTPDQLPPPRAAT